MTATPDQIHATVLSAVKSRFESVPVLGVRGYGPVTDGNGNRKKNCVVLLEDPSVYIPTPIQTPHPDGGGNLRITVVPARAPSAFHTLFSADGDMTRRAALGGALAAIVVLPRIQPAQGADVTVSLPKAWPGKVMGGDVVYNDSNYSQTDLYWGSIGLIASQVTIETQPPFTNVCLSCDHVLSGAGNAISTVEHRQSMTFKWRHPDIGQNGKWVDIAVAQNNTADAKVDHVRGLGKITETIEPTLGTILLKYGSTTGLTAGIDTGLIYRPFPKLSSPALYMVRSIGSKTGRFSFFGDSGSAVVSQGTRKLAGFVIGGVSGGPNFYNPNGENYYIPVLGLAGSPVDPNLSAVRLQLG